MVVALRFLAPTERGGTAVSEEELARRGGGGTTGEKKKLQPSDDDDAAPRSDAPTTMQAVPAPHRGDNGAADAALAHVVLDFGGKLPPAASAVPFAPAVMTFRDVSYHVPAPPPLRELQLLRGLSGALLPGRLTALIGTSGAGKTTLMDVLAGRKTAGRVTGDIRINGHPKEQATFTRISGYVEQTDVHAPQATVREAVLFSAHMRLDAPRARRAAFADEVLSLTELTPIGDALVGVPGASGLSVEQRKRLTIAVELAGNPSILFADEPTSGLDARSAAVVVRALRAGADSGRAVVATVHQPSADVRHL
jgi:ABC-type transport system involved in cytochrome bd biosynthesis fused ATPase/permease subunit